MGKLEPLFSFIQIIIRLSRRLVSRRLVKRHCNPDILRCIQPRLSFEVGYHCFNTVSRVKYIIYYQQSVFVGNLLDEVTHIKDLDLIISTINAVVRRSSDCNVISIDTLSFKDFLHSNTDRRTAPPNGNNKSWLKAALKHLHS